MPSRDEVIRLDLEVHLVSRYERHVTAVKASVERLVEVGGRADALDLFLRAVSRVFELKAVGSTYIRHSGQDLIRYVDVSLDAVVFIGLDALLS